MPRNREQTVICCMIGLRFAKCVLGEPTAPNWHLTQKLTAQNRCFVPLAVKIRENIHFSAFSVQRQKIPIFRRSVPT